MRCRIKIIHLILVFVACGLMASCSGSNPGKVIAKADELVKQNKLDEAVILYQHAIEDDPYQMVYYLNQAKILTDQEKFYIALRNYDVVKVHLKKSPWPFLGRARIFEKQGDLEKALKELIGFLDVNSADPNVSFHLGVLHYKLKNSDQAILFLNKAFEANYQKMFNVYLYRGYVYEELLKNKAKALEQYRVYLSYGEASEKSAIEEKVKSLAQNDFDF